MRNNISRLGILGLLATMIACSTTSGAEQDSKRKDGKSTIACGFDRTVLTIYQADDKTVREVRTSLRDREESIVFRDDGQTVHTRTTSYPDNKRREIDYFGPGKEKRTHRVFYLDIRGEIGAGGIEVTECMDVTVFDSNGDRDYVQHWVYGQKGKQLQWTLKRTMQDKPGPAGPQRTWVELSKDSKDNEIATLWRTGPGINGAAGRDYKLDQLPDEYRHWTVDRYHDDDPTSP